MSKAFTAEKVTDGKRVTRGLLYRRVATLLQDVARPTILFLAGPNPAAEANTVRALMPRARLVAVDTDAARCALARTAQCDVIHGDLADLHHSIRPDFANLDFCGNLPRPFFDNSSPFLRATRRIRQQLRKHDRYGRMVAIWVPYGRRDGPVLEMLAHVEAAHPPDDEDDDTSMLDDPAIARLFAMQQFFNPLVPRGIGANEERRKRLLERKRFHLARHCWVYVGGLPMVVGLMHDGPGRAIGTVDDLDLDLRGKDDSVFLREFAVMVARESTTRTAGALLDVPERRVRAWVATDTRERAA